LPVSHDTSICSDDLARRDEGPGASQDQAVVLREKLIDEAVRRAMTSRHEPKLDKIARTWAVSGYVTLEVQVFCARIRWHWRTIVGR